MANDIEKICPNCGNKIDKQDAFCQNCGSKLEREIPREEHNEKINNKRCPNCNDKIIPGEKFCQKCGTKLEIIEEVIEEKICPKCGKKLNPKDAFCQNCGTRTDIILPLEHIEEKINSKRCPNCNDKIIPGEKYCQKCGTPLDINIIEEIDNKKAIIKKKKDIKVNKSKTFITIIIIMLLMAIIVLSTIIIVNNYKPNKKEGEEEEKDNTNKEANNIITIYYDGRNFRTKKNSNFIEVGTIKAVDKDITILDGMNLYDENWDYDGAIILFKDNNKVKIYNTKEQDDETLNLKNNYERYRIIYNNNLAYGIEYLDGVDITIDKYGSEIINSFTDSGYYNIETGKTIYQKQDYYEFDYVSPYKIKAKKGTNNSKKIYLLDNEIEKVYLSKYTTDEYGCGGITYDGIGTNFIIEGLKDCIKGEVFNGTIYSDNLNLIERNVNINELEEYKNMLYVIKNNIIYKYNQDGKELFKTKEYKEALDIIHDYFVVIENDKITLQNENNLNLVLGDWKDTYEYSITFSDYFTKKELKDNKEEGIYIVIRTDENGYGSGIEYYINPNNYEIKKSEIEVIGGILNQ